MATNADFKNNLLDLSARISLSKSLTAVDLESFWQAYLYLAQSGNSEASDALENFFDKTALSCKITDKIADGPYKPLPLGNEVKRLIGPLSPLYKKHNGLLTPLSFLSMLFETGLASKLDIPEPKPGIVSQVINQTQSDKSSQALITNSKIPKKNPEPRISRSNGLQEITCSGTISPALSELQSELEGQIFGQASALKAFLKGFCTALERPICEGKLGGSFLVLGPNGCGKGEMIRILDKWVTKHRATIQTKQLIYCEGYLQSVLPTLRESIRNSEPSIIVLNEFEKYEPMVRDVLMEGLDRAVLQLPDRHIGGKLHSVDIRGSIIIFVGNVGRALWGRLPFKETEMLPERERIKEVLEEEALTDQHMKSGFLEGRLSHSFLDRIDYFIPFCQLRYADVSRILSREINLFAKELKKDGIVLKIDDKDGDEVRDLITLSSYYKRGWSGRQALRGFKEHIEGHVRNALQASNAKFFNLKSMDKSFNRTMKLSEPRILLIDDEWETIKNVFEKAFSVLKEKEDLKLKKIELICASDISQALTLALEKSFDLVLLDLYFHNKPRWKEYLSAWRFAQPETPVLLLSGQSVSPADRVEIDEMGGVIGFLEKRNDGEDVAASLKPFMHHAVWQAKIRSFEASYGFGGDRIVFDFNKDKEGETLIFQYTDVQSIVSDGSASSSDPPILPVSTHHEVDEFLELFLNVRKRTRFKIKQPKGLLLYGPPGNGKTMLARHIAQQMRCNFMSLSAGDFNSRWAGVATEKIKETFEQARWRQPCVVFIDEIDAVAPKRSGANDSGLLRDQVSTVSVLLTELDGFSKDHEVFLIGATNRKDAIDGALLRPGRIDRIIHLSPPALKERKAVLKRDLSPQSHQEIDIDWAAAETYGLSFAEIIRAIQDSILIALRRSGKTKATGDGSDAQITKADFREAVDRMRYGAVPDRDSLEAKAAISSREIRAWHEAGHLIANIVLVKEVPERVTIIQRGNLGGFIRHSEEALIKKRAASTRSVCLTEIAVMLAGGLSEKMKFGEHSAGVSADRKGALSLAHAMVTEWGMDSIEAEVQGFIASRKCDSKEPASDTGKHATDQVTVIKAVSGLLKEATELANDVLTKHRRELSLAVKFLMKHEELDRSDIEKAFPNLIVSDKIKSQ